jgi:hypothetical protein
MERVIMVWLYLFIYLYFILRRFSVTKTIYRRMIEWKMNGELEGSGRDLV